LTAAVGVKAGSSVGRRPHSITAFCCSA
jgi:hypothetical protein